MNPILSYVCTQTDSDWCNICAGYKKEMNGDNVMSAREEISDQIPLYTIRLDIDDPLKQYTPSRLTIIQTSLVNSFT